MKTHKKRTILLSIILMLSLMLSMVPAASAKSSIQAVVTAKSMKVYAQKSPYKCMGSLPKGTEVTVTEYRSGLARITYKSYTGIVYASNLKAKSTSNDTTSTVKSKAVETIRSTRAYLKPSFSSKYVTLKAGTSLNLLQVSDKYAKVERGGVIGYMYKKDLGEPGSSASSTTETKKAAVVTNRQTRVYAKASTSSKYVTVSKGQDLNLLSVSKNVAKVELNGVVAYAYKPHLSWKTDSSSSNNNDEDKNNSNTGGSSSSGSNTTDGKTDPSTPTDLFNSSYTNEQIIFKFLVQEMNYSTAAACGIVANAKYESGFRPTAGGDGGTSYGILQWHAGRKTAMINWCKSNNYDYTTLKGQLHYLKYELPARYSKVHKYLVAVDNTAQGAYDAAYYFCYHYEAPASKASKSVTRGNYAKTTIWNRFS